MAEIDDDLVPTDGLTNLHLRFAGLDSVKGSGAASVRFDLFNGDDGYPVATIPIVVPPADDGTIDSMIVTAHQVLRDAMRQLLYEADRDYRSYSKRLAR